MASGITRVVGAGVLAATAWTGSCGCAPSDEGAEGRAPAVAELGAGPETPRPAVISFVTPALSEPTRPPAQAIVAQATPPAAPADPVVPPAAAPPPFRPDVPPGITALSRHIDDVMSDLDALVEESLQLQYSLLRLRLRPKQPAPPAEPDPAELPVGL